MSNSKVVSAGIILITSIILSTGIGLLNFIAGNHSIIAYMLSSIPVIISVFYVGASIHLSAIENKIIKAEQDEYGEIITERMNYINSLIIHGKNNLKRSNNSINSIVNTDVSHKNILLLRRILNALEERQDRLVELSRTLNYKEAEEISLAPIVFHNNHLNSLYNATYEIPSISHDKWEETINTLIDNIELKKVAA